MRTEVVTIEYYKFSELSKEAQAKAIESLRQSVGYESFDAEYILEYAVRAAATLGLAIEAKNIHYSGFGSQGDGACFSGNYSYNKDSVKLIKKKFGKTDKHLISIAQELLDLQKKHGYALHAYIEHGSSRYSHSHTMNISVSQQTAKGEKDVSDSVECELRDILRSFADWIYREVEKEYEFAGSDESVRETIINNDYEFDVNGKPL